MLQLNPQENFTIVRQIEDHTDTNTYYVRAIVRNAKTDELLANVDLDLKGDQRYSKDYIVPADVSGQGLWISIVTSVYTDSGHTTKSPDYGDKLDSYLVQERYHFNPNYPIPTGPDIDYKKIRKIIKEELDKMKPIEIPEAKVVVTEIIKTIEVPKVIETIKEVVKEVKIPQIIEKEVIKEVPKVIEVPTKINLSQIEEKIDSLYQDMKEKKGDEEKLTPSPLDIRVKKLLGNHELEERVKKFL